MRHVGLASFLFITLTAVGSYADTVTQDVWSSGGRLGPVDSWGSRFYTSEGVVASGGMLFAGRELTVIDSLFSGARDVHIEDINGDGLPDIAGAAVGSNQLIVWLNTPGSPSGEWTRGVIAQDFTNARAVYVEDIDGDGLMDIVGASSVLDEVAWWRNPGDQPIVWIKHRVDDDLDGAWDICADDVDGDGSLDIIAAAEEAKDVVWYENNGSGTGWMKHTVTDAFGRVRSVCTADIDADGDLDIASGSWGASMVRWWENLDGQGTSWEPHTVQGLLLHVSCVVPADLNMDGDMDLVACAHGAKRIRCWINDGTGTDWTGYGIATGLTSARTVDAADIDGDGDLDVACVADSDERNVGWWENVDGSGTVWEEHILSCDLPGAYSVMAADLNCTGETQLAVADMLLDKLVLTGPSSNPVAGSLTSSILALGNDPGWGAFLSRPGQGSGIGFQFRASDNYTDMGPWSEVLYPPVDLSELLEDYDSFFQYRVRISGSSIGGYLEGVLLQWDPLAVSEEQHPLGSGPALISVRENPVRSGAVFDIHVVKAGWVEVDVFDTTGRIVSEKRGYLDAGNHEMVSDDLQPGTYFARLRTSDVVDLERFVVLPGLNL